MWILLGRDLRYNYVVIVSIVVGLLATAITAMVSPPPVKKAQR